MPVEIIYKMQKNSKLLILIKDYAQNIRTMNNLKIF